MDENIDNFDKNLKEIKELSEKLKEPLDNLLQLYIMMKKKVK